MEVSGRFPELYPMRGVPILCRSLMAA